MNIYPKFSIFSESCNHQEVFVGFLSSFLRVRAGINTQESQFNVWIDVY